MKEAFVLNVMSWWSNLVFLTTQKKSEKIAKILQQKGCRGKVVCSSGYQWSWLNSKPITLRGQVKAGKLYWQGKSGLQTTVGVEGSKYPYPLLEANREEGGYKQVFKMQDGVVSCTPPEWICPLCSALLDWKSSPPDHYRQAHAHEKALMGWFEELTTEEQLKVLGEKFSHVFVASMTADETLYQRYCQLILSANNDDLYKALLQPLTDKEKLVSALLKEIELLKETEQCPKGPDVRSMFTKIEILLLSEIADKPLAHVLEKLYQCDNKVFLTPPDLFLPFLAAEQKKWDCLQVMHKAGVCFFPSIRYALNKEYFDLADEIIKRHPEPAALFLSAVKVDHQYVVEQIRGYHGLADSEVLRYTIDQDDYEGILALDKMKVDMLNELDDLPPVEYARSKKRYYSMFAMLERGLQLTEKDDEMGEHILFPVRPATEYSHQLVICAADESTMDRRFSDIFYYTADMNTTDVIELSRQGRSRVLIGKNRALFSQQKPLKLFVCGHGAHILGMKGDELGGVISNILKLYIPVECQPSGIDLFLLSCQTRAVKNVGTVNQHVNADLLQETLEKALCIPVCVTGYAGDQQFPNIKRQTNYTSE